MNTGNTEALGHAGGSPEEQHFVRESTGSPAALRRAEELYGREQQENFRTNREESLQLCEDFRAFYAANPAYHLDL